MSAGLVGTGTEDHVAVVRLQRPQALNAISGAMAEELADAFRTIAADEDVWVVILAADGNKAFCVGADLKERASFTLDDYYANRKQVRGLFQALRDVPQPVIAAPFGFALGGGFELVLSCDLVVAAESTEFGLPEASVGLLPAGGGTQLLTRKVGPARAKSLIFTGERFGVDEACEMGLLASSAPLEGLEDEARFLADRVCRCSPVAVRAAKRAIDAGLGVPLEEGIEIEDDAWAKVIVSHDRSEGVAAFNEKRPPRWSNK